jgi:hypothetical protein
VAEEKLQIDYDYLIEYLEDAQNAIGATTSTTLRTVTTHNDGNSIYVRKFGLDYLITDVTDIGDPGDPNMTYKVYALDGILLGSRTGGGAFVDGSTVSTAQGCYLEVESSAGTVTVIASITIDTDVDPGGKTFVCATESVTVGTPLRLYLSDTTSTYYDSNYKYGGARHTPDSSSSLPYFDIATAIADPDATGYTITTVLDSEIYDEQYSISISGMILQAAEGQAPTTTSGVGARSTREVSQQYNNITAIYFNENGNDANDGSWQTPKLTLTGAVSARGSKSVIYGGSGATQSGGIFTGNFSLTDATANFILESDYGYVPTFIKSSIATPSTIELDFQTSIEVRGIIVDGDDKGYGLYMDTAVYASADRSIYDCSIINCSVGNESGALVWGANGDTITIKRSFASDCYFGFEIVFDNGANSVIDVSDNFAASMATNSFRIGKVAEAATITGNFQDNVMYLVETNVGLSFISGISNFDVGHNTFFNLDFGVYIDSPAQYIADMDNNIFHTCANHGIFSVVEILTVDNNCFYNNGTDYNGNVTSTNGILTDPKLCKTTMAYKLGISSDSSVYRQASDNDNCGARLRIVEITESDIEINGFFIDGQEYYHNAVYILDTVNHTGTNLKWCSVFDFQGITIDPYDNDTNTDFNISNCKIYNGGNGIKFSYGGNTVQDTLIYNNSVFGIHANWGGNTFNHNVFFNNQYGIYFESDTSAVDFENSITHSNSLYGIFAEVAIRATSCCITDGTNNVDVSDVNNFTDDPLFVNEVLGSEDFNIKTRFGTYSVDSPCFLTADDGRDIGAYDVDRSIDEEGWKKYTLESNPSNMNDMLNAIDQVRFGGALGSRSLWAKAHKMRFPLEWDENHYSTEQQKDKIRYISMLIPTRENGKTKSDCQLRLRLVPTVHLEDGTSATVDATNKTLTDSTKDWTENKYKGFNVGVIFASGSGMVIDAGAKTGTKAGAGWTVDQWIGYYLKYNGYTYYIKSNTATVLTLSDPYSTLVSATIAYSIEKYFEIEEHNETIFTLLDNDSELVDGTYDYYVDFAQVRTMDSKFGAVQPKFAYSREEWKTGYSLLLEQI